MSGPSPTVAAVEREVLALLRDGLALDVPSAAHDLIDSGLLDSLALVDLIARLEQRFALRIDLENLTLDDWRTAAGIARMVASDGGDGGAA